MDLHHLFMGLNNTIDTENGYLSHVRHSVHVLLRPFLLILSSLLTAAEFLRATVVQLCSLVVTLHQSYARITVHAVVSIQI